MNVQTVLMLPVEEIFPNLSQPRKTLPKEELDRMVASIAARGVLQPIRVRWMEQRGCWEVICGETRWRAARLAGLASVPCLPVEDELSETDILADQITENVVRNSLRPLELARALAKLKALKGCDSQTLAAELGISGAGITRAESLLTLPDSIQALVDDGRISPAAAYEISRLPDAQSQIDLAQAVTGGRLNRDQVADAVRSRVGKKAVRPKASRLACKLDGGISFTVSAAQPLTWEDLLAAIDAIRKEAKKLYEGGKDVTALARSLRAS